MTAESECDIFTGTSDRIEKYGEAMQDDNSQHSEQRHRSGNARKLKFAHSGSLPHRKDVPQHDGRAAVGDIIHLRTGIFDSGGISRAGERPRAYNGHPGPSSDRPAVQESVRPVPVIWYGHKVHHKKFSGGMPSEQHKGRSKA